MIYSHSHADHWAGVRGVVDEADVQAGKVEIIAPRDFMDHAISENVYAGEIMPGTGRPAPEEDLNDFEVGPIDVTKE